MRRPKERDGEFITFPGREFPREFLEQRHYSEMFRTIKWPGRESYQRFLIFAVAPSRGLSYYLVQLTLSRQLLKSLIRYNL